MMPTDLVFHPVGCVSATTEEGFWQIAFTDDAHRPTLYLICQNAFEYDEADVRNGIDSHYVECNDQSRSAYGGIERVALGRDRVYFTFAPEAGERLGLPCGLGLSFRLEDEAYAALTAHAARIFGDRLHAMDASMP